jgi:hypothetical protein
MAESPLQAGKCESRIDARGQSDGRPLACVLRHRAREQGGAHNLNSAAFFSLARVSSSLRLEKGVITSQPVRGLLRDSQSVADASVK